MPLTIGGSGGTRYAMNRYQEGEKICVQNVNIFEALQQSEYVSF